MAAAAESKITLGTVKKVCATAAFLLVFLLLFCLVSDVFMDKEYAWYKYRNYSALPKNSVDILYVGNSHFNAAIDAEFIDAELGAGSYGFNYSVSGMRMEYAYYRFQNALRTQSPRLVVLDTFCLVPMDDDESGDNIISWSLDGIPLSADKIEAVNDLVPLEDRPAYYIPFIKYHARWESLSAEDVTSVFDRSAYDWLGRRPETTDRAMEEEDDHFSQSVAAVQGEEAITAKHAEYLRRFIDLAAEKGAAVLLLTVPYRQQFGQNSAANGAMLNNHLRARYANDDSVRLLDANEYYAELDFGYADMRDDGHVNFSGSEKTCRFVVEYIRQNYAGLL